MEIASASTFVKGMSVSYSSSDSATGSSDSSNALTYADIVKKEMDTNGDGEISEKELKNYLSKKKKEAKAKSESCLLKLCDVNSKMKALETQSSAESSSGL